MGRTILILGGARSGKSRLAERLAEEAGPVTYMATAVHDASDPEMAARIETHRQRRPEGWTTLEVPRDLERVLPTLVGREGSVIVDCVTLWITNLMLGLGGGEPSPSPWDDSKILAVVGLVASSARGKGRVIWVTNEVGSGIVPPNPLARRFVDLQGAVNQRLAEGCDEVHFCAAGLSLRLK